MRKEEKIFFSSVVDATLSGKGHGVGFWSRWFKGLFLLLD